MRLLYVIPYYLPAIAFGGPVSVCSKLATGMVTRGHSVVVLTTDVASRTERVRELDQVIDGIRVVRLRNLSQRLISQNLHTPMGCRPILRALLREADVVHVHEFFSWLTYRATQEARSAGKPLLLSGHGSLSLAKARGRTAIKRAWLQVLGKATIAGSNLVQCATPYEARESMIAGVREHQIRIVPQGVKPPPRAGDSQRFRQRFALGDRTIVLFVGRLLESKGVDLLIKVAERLRDHPLEPMFVLVGPAENRPDLEQPGWRARNLLLTGPLHGSDLDDAYRAASLFVLPSFAEGMPVTALDALSFGVPCLLSYACNLPEVTAAGAGMECDPTLKSVENALRHMLDRAEEWESLSSCASKLAAEHFDIEQIHSQYERIYQELKHA
jgi:poly(glycerol-phosphate) alpha-glucosyltransferase